VTAHVVASDVLAGALAMGYALCGLFFLRFWRDTGDRFFGVFATAFWLMAVNRVSLSAHYEESVLPWLYLVRLAAFVLILVAIADKNRTGRAR
jgi:hypothetical protein